jgi:hypothetical protein
MPLTTCTMHHHARTMHHHAHTYHASPCTHVPCMQLRATGCAAFWTLEARLGKFEQRTKCTYSYSSCKLRATSRLAAYHSSVVGLHAVGAVHQGNALHNAQPSCDRARAIFNQTHILKRRPRASIRINRVASKTIRVGHATKKHAMQALTNSNSNTCVSRVDRSIVTTTLQLHHENLQTAYVQIQSSVQVERSRMDVRGRHACPRGSGLARSGSVAQARGGRLS